MLSPALFIGDAQGVWIVVPVAPIHAIRAREQPQPADPTAPPKTRRERKHPTIGRARRINRAPLIRAEKNAGPLLLSQHHQRVPGIMIEQHQAPRLADQIDLERGQPGDELRGGAPRGIHQTPKIGVRQRNPQVATTVTAAGTAKAQVAEAARHGRSLPQFASPRSRCLKCPKRPGRRRLECRTNIGKSAGCRNDHFLLKMPAMLSVEARGPAYRILSERLLIRCWEPRDAASLKLAVDASLTHLRPWVAWAANEPTPLDQKVAWLRKCRGEFDLGLDYSYGVFSQDESEVIGGAGLHLRQGVRVREIGYWVASAHCRRGYATEVTRALLRVGFEVEAAKRIELRVWPENRLSRKIPEALGFVSEGTLRGISHDADGRPCDVNVFALLRDDYECTSLPNLPLRALDVSGHDLL